jgi:hypothetical protein
LIYNAVGPDVAATIELIGNSTGLLPFLDTIRDRFDPVAIDSRDVGRSQPILRNADTYAYAVDIKPYPINQEESDNLHRAWGIWVRSCAALVSLFIEHLDSRTTARDFDLI